MRVCRVFGSDEAHLYATAVAALRRLALVCADDVTDDVTASVPEVGVGGATELDGVVIVGCGEGRGDAGGGMAVVPRCLDGTSVRLR